MRSLKLLAVIALAGLLPGCLDFNWSWPLALYPLVTVEDQASETALLGSWQVEDGSAVLRFEPTEDGGLVMLSCNGPTEEEEVEQSQAAAVETDATPSTELAEQCGERYPARLFRAGHYLYLDLAPEKSLIDEFYVRGHFLVRLDLTGDSLEMAFLSKAWLKEALDSGRLDLAHSEVDDALVLTAPTPELQDFIEWHGNDNEAFTEANRYRRLQ